MLGEKLLIAPVLTGGSSTRSLYVPEGYWIDYWTGETIKGGQQVTVPAPLEHIPILVRAGSIIPFISPDTQTLATDLAENNYSSLGSDITWRVFPGSSSSPNRFTLRDGTAAEASERGSRIEVRVEHSPLVRNYQVILPATSAPGEVMLDERPIFTVTGNQKAAGWRMDPASQTLHVLLQADNFDLTVNR